MIAVPAGGGAVTTSRDWAYALALQPDGKLVAAGLTRAPGTDSLAMARYTATGRLDPRFGKRGKVVASGIGSASALAIQLDGKIVSAVRSSTGNHVASTLVRYGVNGGADAGFSHDGTVSRGFVRAIAVQTSGRIIAAGPALLRYTARGVLDRSFGHGGKIPSSFIAVAIQPDDKIVALTPGGVVVRYTSRGSRDPTFHTAVVDMDGPAALALAPDAKIVVAGHVGDFDASDFAVGRLTPDGTPDTTFGDGGKAVIDFTPKSNCAGCQRNTDIANAVAVQRDGKIVAAGSTDFHGVCDDMGNSCDTFALVRFKEDGSLDRTFGGGGKVVTRFVTRKERSSSVVQSMVIERSGRIVAAGLGNGYDFALARYTTRGKLDPTFGRGGRVLTDFGSG